MHTNRTIIVCLVILAFASAANDLIVHVNDVSSLGEGIGMSEYDSLSIVKIIDAETIFEQLPVQMLLLS